MRTIVFKNNTFYYLVASCRYNKRDNSTTLYVNQQLYKL